MMNALLITRKELADAVVSKRLWVIVSIFIVFSIASTYSTTFGFLILGRQVVRPMLRIASGLSSALPFIAPILGIALGFDTMSGERERGTLKLVLSRPIYREDVVNGKIISAVIVIGLTVSVSSFVSVAVSILLQNVTLTLDDLVRICFLILVSIIFSLAYYALSLFTSTIFSRSSYSLIVSLTVWIFFTFIMPIVGALIAVIVVGPPPRIPSDFNITRSSFNMTSPEEFTNYYRRVAEISGMTQAVSINYHYSQITDRLFGFVSGPRELGQQRVTDIPTLISSHAIDLMVLIIFPIIFLIASYMIFTRRQEK